eukprot:754369-Hanusia_phi.AAC.3
MRAPPPPGPAARGPVRRRSDHARGGEHCHTAAVRQRAGDTVKITAPRARESPSTSERFNSDPGPFRVLSDGWIAAILPSPAELGACGRAISPRPVTRARVQAAGERGARGPRGARAPPRRPLRQLGPPQDSQNHCAPGAAAESQPAAPPPPLPGPGRGTPPRGFPAPISRFLI